MNSKVYLLIFALAVTGLSSCQKTTGDAAPLAVTTTLNLVNATTDTLNLYQNGSRLNNTTNIYPFGFLAITNITSGTQSYQLKKAGSTDVLVETPLTINYNKLYTHTLFIAGEATDKLFVTTDTTVKNTDVLIRFVNASPMTSNVDVYIGSNFVYKNRAFKSATNYIAATSGKNVLSIYQAGTTTLLAGGTLTLITGTAYTLYTKGVINGTGNNAFGARIVNN